jgi:hypothetical protein
MVMMGTEVKSTEEVLTVESKKAPEGTYGPPEGYAELPFNPAALLGGG